MEDYHIGNFENKMKADILKMEVGENMPSCHNMILDIVNHGMSL